MTRVWTRHTLPSPAEPASPFFAQAEGQADTLAPGVSSRNGIVRIGVAGLGGMGTEHARNVLHRQLSGKWRKSVESYGHLAAFTPARAQSSSGAGM